LKCSVKGDQEMGDELWLIYARDFVYGAYEALQIWIIWRYQKVCNNEGRNAGMYFIMEGRCICILFYVHIYMCSCIIAHIGNG
jgi:hypothetical protein